MGLVEPPMAATLELQRLRAFDQVRGSPSWADALALPALHRAPRPLLSSHACLPAGDAT